MKMRVAGFTLVELMVVVAIMAILAAVAIPSFQDTVRRNAVDSLQLDLISAVNQARQEAVTRGTKISICRSTDQAACAGSAGDWGSGWIIFINNGTAGTVANNNDILAKHGPGKQNIAVTLKDSSATQLIFLQFTNAGYLAGSSPKTAWFKLCTSDNKVINARSVLLEKTGRALQSKLDLGGSALTCP